jgi:hypothetical protein
MTLPPVLIEFECARIEVGGDKLSPSVGGEMPETTAIRAFAARRPVNPMGCASLIRWPLTRDWTGSAAALVRNGPHQRAGSNLVFSHGPDRMRKHIVCQQVFGDKLVWRSRITVRRRWNSSQTCRPSMA